MILILDGLSTLHKQSLDISMIREFLQWSEPFKFEEGKPLTASSTQAYEIKLENLSYRYPGAQTDILNNEDIRQYNRRYYYKLFSAVFQDYSVLDIGIRENVAQTYTDIDDAKVASCLAQASLTEKVNKLPKGVETAVGRQIYREQSGGQLQRLMLARALYKDGPILVLDEPTAALDPIAEAEIYSKFDSIVGDKTAVYISHRLSSCRFCDEILVFDSGHIVQQGTHEALVAKDGKYQQLWTAQAQYYE